MEKDKLIKSTDPISKGDVESVPGKGDASGMNNPDEHFDVHKNAKKFYDIEKSPKPGMYMPGSESTLRYMIKVKTVTR